ncbi:MAG: tRNA dihydrouridine synthase DusB [Rhizobiaceae bacterium]|nr:tRNA dihydrouridine synthase DusB [Rhizobiaceae bacterium]
MSKKCATGNSAVFLCNLHSEHLNTPLVVGGVTLRNRVFLAPMSGVTDLPFRRLAYGHGAGLVVSEMVASGELAKGRGDTQTRIKRDGDMPHMVQLAGRDSAAMAEAARIAEGEGADIIDINMGCPAKKVTGGYCGSALMRNLDHAVSLIDSVVGAVSVPVTVKMRLGWDDESRNAPELAARAEQSGVQMITVHGRTRCQFYEGKADWVAIAAVKAVVSVPVVANGDCANSADAVAMLEASGADAIMVGRANYGAPWTTGSIVGNAVGTPNNIGEYVIAHYREMLGFYGIESGLRQARKHLRWYLDRNAPDVSSALRQIALQSFQPSEVEQALRDAFARSAEVQEAA